jgi:predicted DNA-binding mobile mystery protein A
MRSTTNTAALARKHLDRRLNSLRKSTDLARPPRGWIKAIREALGMTTAQLAERMGVSQTRVSRIEKDEVGSAIKLRTLRQAAEALDCTLVYALVPNQELEQIVRHRAAALTRERLARTHHTMKLENQALTSQDLDAEHARVFRELLEGNPRRLWSKP